MTSNVQIVTTLPSREAALELGRALVERRLVACAQAHGPIISVYRWQDAVETSEEWVCALKTSAELYRKVEAAIRERHPYETPEIIALPIVNGSRQYLDWIDESTRGTS